ncbi:DUF5057 domain-containing protein [Fusibacter paucivorans]|uniref:DUF5057 domain-containing protein n=1 Tax=Fusibacter paucivorans TaxID=76009 RepID=A0ABS5PRU2_9FIRM|nr:DUF5057 domain-containing protein [Fusibacter paucivorans]MBS7527880.1 DUF5057 domain-containing protein [Fusibacter paucivorans]
MTKKILMLFLIITMLMTSFPIVAAGNGNGNGNAYGNTRLNILYLSGVNGNSADAQLATDIDKYFVDDVDVKVYHKEIKNFSMNDFTKKDYSAIYIAASVLYNIEHNQVNPDVLAKLKAFDYPTVVENALAKEFGLANNVVDVNLDGYYYQRNADAVKVMKVDGHREFSENVISDSNFTKLNYLYQYEDMYWYWFLYYGYGWSVDYQAVSGLKNGAIVSTTTEEIPGDSYRTYPLIYGYEPNNSSLSNQYRVAGTYGTTNYSHYLSDESLYLIADAVWWVLNGGAGEQSAYTVETYDDVSGTALSTVNQSVAANTSYNFEYTPVDGYRFLRWERTLDGVTTTLSDNASYSEIPRDGATYRAVVERVYAIQLQTYDITNEAVINQTTSYVRKGSALSLSYETISGYEFYRWVKVNATNGSVSVVSSSVDTAVTPTGDSIYRAETIDTMALPAKLNILEVQPSANYVLNKRYLENELRTDVELTQMPMSLFIADRTQLNGAYDIIYIGQDNSGSENNHEDKYYPAQDSDLKYTGYLDVYDGRTKSFSTYGGIGEYYSPNDITQLKADELKAFIEADQLVLFDGSIFSSSKATLLKSNFEDNHQTNVKVYSSVTNDRVVNLLNDYNGEAYVIKPTLTVLDNPLSFIGSNGTGQYMTAPEDRYMSFNFKLEDYIADHQYNAELYLDFNGDGIFSTVDGESVAETALYSENFENVLMRYNLPKEYIGFVPWKIEVTDQTVGAKTYEIGYAAFKGTSDAAVAVRHIKVLQITPNNGGSYKLTELPQALKKIMGLYTLEITQMSVDAYNANPFELNGLYDMLVLGFADSLSTSLLLSDAAMDRIQSFVDSGQSLLTTHDQLWFKLNHMGTTNMDFTERFRDQFGQNTYAKDYINNNQEASNDTMLPYTTINGRSYFTVGYSNRAIDRYNQGLKTTNSAVEVNEGQITLFPYILGNTLDISTTHFQYFQLDMENEDLVVWHNLTGGSYDGNDAQNDYYVYSIGNITYSGTGHASPKTYNDENELFVNTMIKASKTANHAPAIVIDNIVDGAVYYKTDESIRFGVTVSDLDLKDTTSTVSIYFDTDMDGVGDVLAATYYDVDNDQYLSVNADKRDLDAYDLFNIIVVASDQNGAKTVETIHNISNISRVGLAISQDTEWSDQNPLIGDSSTLSIEMKKTEAGDASFSDIIASVIIPKAELDAVTSDYNVVGWSGPSLVGDSYVYTKAVSDYTRPLEFTPYFNGSEGTINASIELQYDNYGTPAEKVKAGPMKLTVEQGQMIVSAMDRFNRPVDGALLTIEGASDEIEVETVGGENVIVDLDGGTKVYTVRYNLDGYKDAEIIVTYDDGTVETIKRNLTENYILANIALSGAKNPVDISLKLYQDIITDVQVVGDIGLIVEKNLENNQTVFNNMGDANKTITINYNLDEPTTRMTLVFDDSGFTSQIAGGSYSLLNEEGDVDAVIRDVDGNVIVSEGIVFDTVNRTLTVDLGAGNVFEPGVYSMSLTMHFAKGLKIYTTNQPHVIDLVKLITDVYSDADENGIYAENERFNGIEKLLEEKIVVGYLVFTDNTEDEDARNGIVGFKTRSTNILEGAGYGDVELYIKPSKDVSFENVNIQLMLRYMENGSLVELENNENFYIVSIEEVRGLDVENVVLQEIDGNNKNTELLIKELPIATDDDDAVIKVKIFVENSKFDFQDYRLVFSLIYGVNVQEAEINQYIQIIKRLKLQ